MVAYYNENDSQAAAWLRELIKNGLIAHGDVDERDIRDVPPADLGGYTQCHFFAGIGGWSYALRLAGWPDDKPVWTGSCPCQPFSTAGRGKGVTDERHLWPHFHWLIEQCRPSVVFGEQVASKDGLAWLDLVSADMEGSGYAFGAADLCAAGVGSPHIRQRLYWVADAEGTRRGVWNPYDKWQANGEINSPSHDNKVGRVANADGVRRNEQRLPPPSPVQGERAERGGEHAQPQHAGELPGGSEGLRGAGGVANAESSRWRKEQQNRRRRDAGVSTGKTFGRSGGGSSGGLGDGFWRDADWLYCRDGKWRPVEPGTFPLAHGVPARVGRLRGYGNAIVPQVAQTFIEAYLETNGDNNERRSQKASPPA